MGKINKCDTTLTDEIRATLAAGRSYVGPLMTTAEIDWLLDEDDAEEESDAIYLTEEMVYRSIGIRVDLAPEGPAASNVIAQEDVNELAHASYHVISTEGRVKTFDPNHPDSGLIPKRTPEDSNIVVTSINHGASRPKGNKLEGLKIESNRDPVEASFINALTTCQALDALGVDVTELCGAVDAIWGIDYSKKVVDEVALANIEDLSTYLAEGGRPSPAIYISPNLTSSYVISARPTITPAMVGSYNIYFARSAAIASLTVMLTNMIWGERKLKNCYFTLNTSQFSKFDPGKLKGTAVRLTDTYSRSNCASMLVNASTYDTFINTRISAKSTMTYEKDLMTKTFAMVAPSVRATSLLTPAMAAITKDEFFAYTGQREGFADRMEEQAEPSKMTSVLYGMFHGEVHAKMYEPCMDLCASLLVSHCTVDHSYMIGPHWCRIAHMKGMATLLASVNTLRVSHIREIRTLMDQSNDPKDLVRAYLYTRTFHLNRFIHTDAIKMVKRWEETGLAPARLYDSYPDGVRMPGSTEWRVYKALFLILAKVKVLDPYSRWGRISAVVMDEMSTMNPLNMTAVEWADSSKGSIDREAFSADRNRKTDMTKLQATRVRTLFSKVRDSWSSHYSRIVSARSDAMSIALDMSKTHDYSPHALSCRRVSDMKPSQMIVHGLLQEAAIAAGKSLAYEFMQLTLLTELDSADMLGSFTDWYIAALKYAARDEVRSWPRIDPKTHQFANNSHLSKKRDLFLRNIRYSACAEWSESSENYVKGAIEKSYLDSVALVRATIEEALVKDWDRADASNNRGVRATTHSEVVASSRVREKVAYASASNFVAAPAPDEPVITAAEMADAISWNFTHSMLTAVTDIDVVMSDCKEAHPNVSDYDPVTARMLREFSAAQNYAYALSELTSEEMKVFAKIVALLAACDPSEVCDYIDESFKAVLRKLAGLTADGGVGAIMA